MPKDAHKQDEVAHLVKKSKGNGWVGVDLDGTLAEYKGWRGGNHIGKPIQPMVDRIKKLLAKGITVKIFTARVAVDPGREAEKAIHEWCKKYIGEDLEVTNIKDFSMIKLYDDRARQVVHNTGEVVGDDSEDDAKVPVPLSQELKDKGVR